MFVGYKNIWRCLDIKKANLQWVKISDNLGGSNANNMAVVENSPADPNILYAVRSDSKFFRSDNSLSNNPSWNDLSNFLPAAGEPTDVEAHPSEPSTVYITLNKKVYKSTDKGLSWTEITGTLPNIHISTIAFYKNAPEGLYVGTDAGVYYRDQTTSDWIQFSEGLPANSRVTEAEIYYDNDSVSQDAVRISTYGRGLWGSDTYRGSVSVDFEASQTVIPTGCSIDFTDLSTGVPTFFQWTFEGATPGTSGMKNPSGIEYNTPGTYQVTLKAWNENGADSLTKTAYITVDGTLLPVADFTADKFAICSGETVRFSDLTQYCPYGWTWSFEPGAVTYLEGTNNHSQNPVVQFNQKGAYTVKLTAFNAIGSSTVIRQAYILNGGYIFPFGEDFDEGFEKRHWTVENPDSYVTWDTISVPGIGPESKSAWMNFYNYLAIGRRDQLISPPLDLSAYSSAVLWFKHAYAQRATMKDSLIIKVSDDCGETWSRVFATGPDGTPDKLVTHPATMDPFYPESADDWCGGSYGVDCYQIDISQYGGSDNVRIMFEAYNRYGNNLFIDDIHLSTAVGKPEPNLQQPVLKVYPNPTTGMVTAEIHTGGDEVSLRLYNMQGICLLYRIVPTREQNLLYRMDLSSLTPGIYYLQVITAGGTGISKIVRE